MCARDPALPSNLCSVWKCAALPLSRLGHQWAACGCAYQEWACAAAELGAGVGGCEVVRMESCTRPCRTESRLLCP